MTYLRYGVYYNGFHGAVTYLRYIVHYNGFHGAAQKMDRKKNLPKATMWEGYLDLSGILTCIAFSSHTSIIAWFNVLILIFIKILITQYFFKFLHLFWAFWYKLAIFGIIHVLVTAQHLANFSCLFALFCAMIFFKLIQFKWHNCYFQGLEHNLVQ